MELLKVFKSDKGLTIVEILITIAIMVVIFSLGLMLSMDFYRTYAFNYEKDLIVGILQKARSQSMANIFQTTHGVTFDDQEYKYIIFNGEFDVNDAKNQDIQANKSIEITWSQEAVFNQLEGSCKSCTLSEIEITLSYAGKESIITINHEGRINY